MIESNTYCTESADTFILVLLVHGSVRYIRRIGQASC